MTPDGDGVQGRKTPARCATSVGTIGSEMHGTRRLALAVIGPLAFAVVWALMTEAGFPGAIGGTCITIGVTLFFFGISFAGGVDSALDNIHAGANVQRVAEQGTTGPQITRSRTRRWTGMRTVGYAAIYLAVGAAFWALR